MPLENIQRSPFSRGDSDAYYGRSPTPRKTVNGDEVYDLTPKETDEFWRGYYENPSDRKVWE